jgi:dihydroorotase-like cyclic amidohydrolase
VLLDLVASHRVEADEFRSRSANSWLLGERVTGKVRMTLAAGRVVHET